MIPRSERLGMRSEYCCGVKWIKWRVSKLPCPQPQALCIKINRLARFRSGGYCRPQREAGVRAPHRQCGNAKPFFLPSATSSAPTPHLSKFYPAAARSSHHERRNTLEYDTPGGIGLLGIYKHVRLSINQDIIELEIERYNRQRRQHKLESSSPYQIQIL